MGNQVVIAVGTFILLLTGLLLGYVLSQLVLGFLAFNLLTFFWNPQLNFNFWYALLRFILAIAERAVSAIITGTPDIKPNNRRCI